MNKDVYKSPLPSINDVGQLNFWKVIGVASMLMSCHSRYSRFQIADFFKLLKKAFNDQCVIILFNSEKKPCGLAIYALKSSEMYQQYGYNNDDVIFESIVAPFSSPLPFYRFLKQHCIANNISCERAYLKDSDVVRLRRIW